MHTEATEKEIINGYFSESTIDSPPKETKEPEQINLVGIEEEKKRLTEEPHERKFKCDIKLTLGAEGDKSIVLPILCGEFPSSRVFEMIELAFKSRRIKNIISAVLDNPVI